MEAHETHQRARLPPACERELVEAAKAGDATARDELIEAFLPLIASVARIYRGSAGVERGELMQEGVVGLLRALRRFDLALGTPFWAYASWWVRQAMQQLVSQLARPVVLSDRAVRQLARIKTSRREFLQAQGREPTCGDLAEATGLARAQVENLVVAERSARGLEEPISGEEGAVGTLGDLLADPAAEEAYEDVPRRLEIEEVRGLLARLSRRERTILIGRFGLRGREQTLRELACSLGVSAERVRQIEQRALAKLRAAVDDPSGRPTYGGDPRPATKGSP
jgi:RNA polymerase sigma factor (sigma-70 family)